MLAGFDQLFGFAERGSVNEHHVLLVVATDEPNSRGYRATSFIVRLGCSRCLAIITSADS